MNDVGGWMVAAGSSVKLNSCIYEGLHLERKKNAPPPSRLREQLDPEKWEVGLWLGHQTHLTSLPPKINMFNIFHRVRVSVCVNWNIIELIWDVGRLDKSQNMEILRVRQKEKLKKNYWYTRPTKLASKQTKM